MTIAPPSVQDPIWTLYPLEDIQERTGYALSSLWAFKTGRRRPGAPFRRIAALAYRRPESELFLEVPK